MLLRDAAKPFQAENLLPLLEDIANKRQEHFVVITLNDKKEVINRHVVFMGTVNASIVHPREVFACALEDGAVSIVIAHNHPSGDSSPSIDDKDTTDQLIAAGNILGIRLHDHIVISKNNYYSFLENGSEHTVSRL